MQTYGKSKVRSLPSFGAAGLLNADCRIFYQNLFDAVQIGRFSDLINARLKKSGHDELRLRLVILLSIFEAFRTSESEQGASPKPVRVECGIDAEAIALSVSFQWPSTTKFDVAKIQERLKSGVPEGEFEASLHSLRMYADQLVIRYLPSQGKVEIASLLSLLSQTLDIAISDQPPIQWMVMQDKEVQETPKALSYTEMGDLDYEALLKDDPILLPEGTLPSGEFVVRALETDAEPEFQVDGGMVEDPSKLRLGGKDRMTAEEFFRVASRNKNKKGSDRILVGGDGSGPAGNAINDMTDLGGAPAQGKGLLNRIWPFKKKGEAAVGPSMDSGMRAEALDAKLMKMLAPDEKKKREMESGPSTESMLQAFIKEVTNGGLDAAINRFQNEAGEIKKELTTARSKKWIDGLSQDLLAEKANLREIGKRMNTQIRQKEHEFKAAQVSLREEVRKRDEMLAQKEATLARMREQLLQITKTLERSKQLGSNAGDEPHYKSKYSMAQKMIKLAKDESAQLAAKVEQLQVQLNQVQLNTAGKTSGPSQQDFNAMKNRSERLQRQLDEFRKVNQTLVTQLAQKKDRMVTISSAASADEMKRKMETALKAAQLAKKESEQLHAKIAKYAGSERQMMAEIAKLQEALNKTKKAG